MDEEAVNQIDEEKRALHKKYREPREGKILRSNEEYDRVLMMGFIAYAQNIENSVRMLAFSSKVNLSEVQEKNRLFVTGLNMMSLKASDKKGQLKKLCAQLGEAKVFKEPVKKSNALDRS